jgi:hypothetical protein
VRSEPDIDERGGSEGLFVRTLENGGNSQKRSERNTQRGPLHLHIIAQMFDRYPLAVWRAKGRYAHVEVIATLAGPEGFSTHRSRGCSKSCPSILIVEC